MLCSFILPCSAFDFTYDSANLASVALSCSALVVTVARTLNLAFIAVPKGGNALVPCLALS